MKACWNELFALGLAQCSNVMNVGTILSAIINHLQTSLQEGRSAPLLDQISEKPINVFKFDDARNRLCHADHGTQFILNLQKTKLMLYPIPFFSPLLLQISCPQIE